MELLLTEKEKDLYADKAYASMKYDQLLEEKGIENRILHKGKRNQPMSKNKKTKTVNGQLYVDKVSGEKEHKTAH